MSAGVQAQAQTLSQAVSLVNDVDIDYTAVLTNVASAKRIIERNGNTVSKTTIDTSPYLETLQDMRKGKYTFTLRKKGVGPSEVSIRVPNYAPTADFSSMDARILKDTSRTFDLCGLITDKNLEDNPVPIVKAVPLTGNIERTLSGCNLTVTSTGNTGPYQLNIKFGVKKPGKPLPSAILSGEIVPQDQIAFWSLRDTNGGFCDDGDICNEDIYVINEDRTNERRLTTDSNQDLEPAWSPDGTELLFTSHRTGGTAVWRMDARDGNNQRDITSAIVERARHADWCSNGQIVVAYRNNGDSEAGIGIIDPEGTSFTSIYSEPRTGNLPGWPKWSPNCSEIIFEKHNGVSYDIWKMDSNGNNLVNLINNPSLDVQADWFSNENSIIFISDRDGNRNIYKMNSDGSDQIPLTNDLGEEVDPAVSPDGERIAFTHDIDLSNPQIYIMNSDGTGGWTLLTTVGTSRYPAWRPRP